MKQVPANGVAPAPDPDCIAVEVYLLDALIKHAEAVANQFVFRRKTEFGQQLIQVLQPLLAFRHHVDATTRSGIVLVGPGQIPKAQG